VVGLEKTSVRDLPFMSWIKPTNKVQSWISIPNGSRNSKQRRGVRWLRDSNTRLFERTSLFSTTHVTGRLNQWRNTDAGAKKTSRRGWDMAEFEYRQAAEIRDAFARHKVQYLFLGKSGAILLGYPDTTQDADIFPKRSPENGRAIADALKDLGFVLGDIEVAEIVRGKDFVQLKNGPFDLDLIFAPDGIERFEDAWKRRVVVDDFPVCHPDDIIASKVAANRAKDRESLDRLQAFRDYWVREKRHRSAGGFTS
jgi:hypothetical protein